MLCLMCHESHIYTICRDVGDPHLLGDPHSCCRCDIGSRLGLGRSGGDRPSVQIGAARAGPRLALRPSYVSETRAGAWGREGGSSIANEARPASPSVMERAEDATGLCRPVRIVPLSWLELSSDTNVGKGCPRSQPNRATAPTARWLTANAEGRLGATGSVVNRVRPPLAEVRP